MALVVELVCKITKDICFPSQGQRGTTTVVPCTTYAKIQVMGLSNCCDFFEYCGHTFNLDHHDLVTAK